MIENIRILGIDYKVEYVNDKESTIYENGVEFFQLGKCDEANAVISVRESANEQVKAQTLFHEVTHAILGAMGNELNSDEEFVCTFSSILHLVLRENPHLISRYGSQVNISQKFVKVLGTYYTVMQPEGEVNGKKELIGEYVEAEQKLYIRADMPYLLQEQTLFHELLHSILYNMGNKLASNEQFICTFSGMLHCVLRDNEQLYKGC